MLAGSCAPSVSQSPLAQVHSDTQRLQALAAERGTAAPDKNYQIGPDDLVEVSVFNVEEMHRKLRVDTDGKIQLPLVGAVQVTGLSEGQVTGEIAKRLEKFVRDPQVSVFVVEYKSQQVAVTGSVAKPGLYSLPRERRSMMDMISEAGGLTRDAGALLQFIPARPDKPAVGTMTVTNPPRDDPRGMTVDVAELMRGGPGGPLNVTVVPGDVIFVPEAGSFTIDGWVDKPGTYPISRNTTLLAALSAAGGPLLPAKLNHVQLLRSAGDNNAARSVNYIDLKAVRAGESPDVELYSGDIIRVPGYIALMIPWGVYTFVKSLMVLGASLPVV